MLHRSKSRDRSVGPPGPVFMFPQQKEEYLRDLRTNRVARPTGARPPPSSFHSVRQSLSNWEVNTSANEVADAEPATANTPEPVVAPPRCTSAQSFHRKTSSSSFASSHIGRPLVRQPPESGGEQDRDQIPYVEGGARWMERQEARSLRMALEDLDLEKERRLHEAAQNEASELVWKHQNPNAPYRYKDHLRKGSYARATQDLQHSNPKLRNRDSSSSRSPSGSSTGSSRVPSDSSLKTPDTDPIIGDTSYLATGADEPSQRKRSVQFVPTVEKRVIDSKEPVNPGSLAQKSDRDTNTTKAPALPVVAKVGSNVGSVHFRNPFSRVRSKIESIERPSSCPPQETKKHHKVEIQRNPPSQSRNAGYTVNHAPPASPATGTKLEVEEEIRMKDGKEIRSDDIRKATSMSLKDRSAKLPTPSLVTDSPGRPIVSFDKPKEITFTEEKSAPVATMGKTGPQSKPPAAMPQFPGPPSINVSASERKWSPTRPSIPTINFPDSKPIPSIQVEGPPRVPLISVNSAPPSTATPPMISVTPSITVNGPSISIHPLSTSLSEPPSISVTPASGPGPSARPLPVPGKSSRPGPRHTATAPVNSHSPRWTPASRRSTALCSHCALPISGRIVTAAGVRFHPECFRCYHCSEALECVAFYPEPDTKRAERIARIHARMNGETVEDGPAGCTEESDGDESLRFYCHLDFHEFFSPRCKSCKTPIEGEVIVACGAEWHSGHFFCAQCGDPFDASTPFVEKDGYAWCVNCHTHRFSTKCKKCRKPVVDTVVKALGAEWHEECFCCTECKGQFRDGRYFLRPGGDEPFCPACEEKRLKA